MLNNIDNVPDLNIIEDGDYSQRFNQIAEELMRNYSIVKGCGDNQIRYQLIEIEFYYCSKEHFDILTYPRIATSGDWFFHNSGADLCLDSNIQLTFKKKVKSLDGNKHYGGILIRSLKKFKHGEDPQYILGPLNCLDELFYTFSAFTNPVDFPILMRDNTYTGVQVDSCGRYFNFDSTPEEKLRAKLKEYFDDYSNIKTKDIQLSDKAIEDFIKYFEAPYRFFIKSEFDYIEDLGGSKYAAEPKIGFCSEFKKKKDIPTLGQVQANV